MPRGKKTMKRKRKKEPEDETAGDPFSSGLYHETEVRYKDLLVKIRYCDITRNMRDKSLEIGAVAFKQAFPGIKEGAISPVAFEKALIEKCVKSWQWFRVGKGDNGEQSETPFKVPPPQLGWETLNDEELGNKIALAVGVGEVMKSTFNIDKAEEVVKAKN